MTLLSKEKLIGRLEPGILERMPDIEFKVQWKHPEELVTWNRLDIGMRTLYLELKDRVPDFAEEIYYEDLRAQSLDSFVDSDNPSKSSFDIFKKVFSDVSEDILSNGFVPEKTVLPLSITGSILNGGHRLSAALIHNKRVACIDTQLPPITCDYQYFFDRAVAPGFIEQAVIQLSRFMENVFVAFLWPSGAKNTEQTAKLFENKIYMKELTLTNKGALNLLYQCYHHMEWVGAEKTNYRGLHQKLFECFPINAKLTMIVFQAPGGLDEVRRLKQQVRDINGIGFSSVHITDTKEELLRILNLICNKNGLHYLNNADLIREDKIVTLDGLKYQASKSNVDLEAFAVDGSLLLDLYGIRKANDIDIIAASDSFDLYSSLGFEPRVKELKCHAKLADDLIYDPRYHFYFFGVKFVGFNQLALMKKNRGESKDLLDLKLMSGLLERNHWRVFKARILQRWLYARIRVRNSMFLMALIVLRVTRLYVPVRAIYRRLKKSFR